MQLHESGIKIFGEDEYVHPDDLDDSFLELHNLKEGDVFLMCGTPYRVEDEFGIGDLCACKISPIGLSEWVLSGNSHPKIKWHGSFAVYEDGDRNNANPILVPYKGKTYFCHNYSGEIIDFAENECFEYQESERSGFCYSDFYHGWE